LVICKKGAFSQFLRIRRNCTTVCDYDSHSQKLLEAYQERGYPVNELHLARDKVRSLSRDNLLKPKTIVEQNTDSSILVCTLPYNRLNVDARKIITDNWHLLSESPHLSHIFKDTPIFGYTRPKNFKDHLCKAAISYPPTASSIAGTTLEYQGEACDRPVCTWCDKINHRTRVKSHSIGERHKKLIPDQVDCGSCNIIYLITCNDCHSQYVGESKRSFRARISEHDRDVRFKKDTPVARHFKSPQHRWAHCTFDIVEHI
jgi:hypothetical protein